MTNTKYYINTFDGVESISEEFGRVRCGFLYEIKFRDGKWIYLDLNHKLIIEDNKLSFEKKKDFDGNEWDYAKCPIKDSIIHYYPLNNPHNESVQNFVDILRQIYGKQEKTWR